MFGKYGKFVAAGVLVAVVAVAVALYSINVLRSPSTAPLEDVVKEFYTLSNPGLSVSEVVIVPDWPVYRAIVKAGSDLSEVFIDPEGRYIFPSRIDLNRSIDNLRLQLNFFSCLQQKGVILFGSNDNFTALQFSQLGNSPYISYIYADCSGDNVQRCLDLNITRVPTWVIGGRAYAAILSASQLSAATNCTG